jgi:hypothetical protein
MALNWHTQDTGLGYKIHMTDDGDYAVEPEDLDIKLWSAWFGKEEIGVGSWQQCRKLCQAHADSQ